ncbi:MAG TPA: hypothetical protein VFI26_01165 [Lysobacter sp.]|nr:hypothetical protein [Lysobacter sp.]
MYTQDNPYYPAHDFPRNWSADELAAAVPLRLSERVSLGLVRFDQALQAANADGTTRRPKSYLPVAAMSAFIRVR